MQRREFITAAVGMTAAVASASQAFAQQDYPDFGAIKKMPVGEVTVHLPLVRLAAWEQAAWKSGRPFGRLRRLR
jgi:hypothetical protein